MDTNPDWRHRLSIALDNTGMSMRGASLKAGLGPNFVQQLLKDGKDPTVGSLIALSRVLGTSVAHLIGEKAA